MIYKHAMQETPGYHHIKTEKGARIIDAGINYETGMLDVWSENNEAIDGAPQVERGMFVAWTGGEAPSNYRHIRSMRCTKTGVVWHVYENPPKFQITEGGDNEFRVTRHGNMVMEENVTLYGDGEVTQ